MTGQRGNRLVEVRRCCWQLGHEFVDPAAVVQVDTDDLGWFDGSQVSRCVDPDRPTIASDQHVAVAANLGRITIEQNASNLSHGGTPLVDGSK